MLFPPTLGRYLLLTSLTATGVLLLPIAARSVDDQQATTKNNNPGGNVVVTMAEGIDKVLAQISATTFADVGTKRTALYNALRAHADTSQASVISALKSVRDSIIVRSHWLTNQLVVLNSDSAEMRVLQGRSDVSTIEVAPSVRVQLEDPEACDTGTTAAPTQLDYNIEIMRLSAVWEKGVNGTGVVVGSIDSGVHHTHETLRHSYKNDSHSWYDAVASRARPYDDLGIGTMSMAILAGAEGVGVAFGAKWISCKAFNASGGGEYEHLISCGEWML